MTHSVWNRFIGVTLVFLLAATMAFLVGCSARRGPEEPTLPPVSREPVTIGAVTFSEEQDYTRVAIEGSGELTYESLELLEDPLRISVEIPNASLEVVTPISVNNGTVTEIIAIKDGEKGRIDIGLADRVDYTITQEANRLYIDVQKARKRKPIVAGKPAMAKEVETLTKMRPAKAVTDVSVRRRGSLTEVAIRADGVIGDYNAFTLESPARLVIDLWNLKNLFPKGAVPAETPHLKRLRIGTHPKKTRLVLDSSASKVPPYRIDRFQDELVVALGEVEALKLPQKGLLAGVDFKQIDDRSRLVLSSSERVEYEIFKVSAQEIVIDLKKTMAPKHLTRDLDTRAFESAVEYIRLYNVRSETSRDVRVVIRLREVMDFEAFQEGNRIFVDFQRPSRQQVETSGRVTPEAVPEPAESEKIVVAQEEGGEARNEIEDVEPEPSPPAPAVEETPTKEAAAVGETVKAAPVEEEVKESSPPEVAEAKKEGVEKAKPEPKTSTPEVTAKEKPFYELALQPGKEYTGRRLSLDFKDADIKNILRLIAEVSDLNIVAGDDVKGKVTIRLIDVPWDQALDIILFSNNLGKMRMGNVIRVAPVDVLKKEEEELLTAKRSREKLEDLVTELIPVSYSTAQELQAQVKNILSERGSVSIDTRTNTLIVKDIPKNVVEARNLVESLDTRTPQVIIEARIVEASTTFSRELGIRWGATLQDTQIGGETGTIGVQGALGSTSNVTNIAAQFPAPTSPFGSGVVFNLADLGDVTNLDVELSAMEQAGEGEIISAPRITTLDNSEARIEQGLRIPYLKLTAEGVATTEFIEANINLTVTPHVTADGHIKMNIKAAKDSPDDTITVQGVPAIDKKEAVTEVLVADGDVVVIGGIYSIERGDRMDRVPLLGKVPLLGFFFRHTQKQDDRRDLLIFISPTIVKEEA